MNMFSTQQLCAKDEAIDAFRNSMTCWVMLLAQMQSGKTNTFLLIACELIRFGLIEHVVIFSGNTETELRDQLKDQLTDRTKFFRKYTKYLRDNGMESEDDREDFIEKLYYDNTYLGKIRIVWGGELNSYRGPTHNTLFIWEESHFAQSLKNRPDKFLKSIGVSADGDYDILKANNNLMVSVSATPFSELCDSANMEQKKHIVKMYPGDSYVSVKDIRDSGRIRSFPGFTPIQIKKCISDALSLDRQGKRWYGIVRVSTKTYQLARQQFVSKGWRCVCYDSVSNDAEGNKAWDNLDKEPTKNTVIFIRGKCRMGKNLEKSHLLFAIETSTNSKTDTVLQGLLGRVCGYSTGSDRVVVYMSSNITDYGDIDRYIKLWEDEGIQHVPKKANNVKKREVNANTPIIPIRICIDRTRFPTNSRKDLLLCLKAAFEDSCFDNKNPEDALDEVRFKVANYESGQIGGMYADKKKESQMYRLREVDVAFEQGIARDFGTGGGINTDATEIKFWVTKELDTAKGFNPDFMFITTHVSKESMGIKTTTLPSTTGNEVFAHKLEDGSNVECNGGMTIKLSSHTSNNADAMQSELGTLIDISLKMVECERKVTSCWDTGMKDFKGILVTEDIYKKLIKKGSIHTYMYETYGVLLSVCKSSGRVSNELKSRNLIKLASISW